MKKLIYLLLFTAPVATCLSQTPNKHLTYQNIVIFSDMSSRIRNPRFPQKDTEAIHNLVLYFKDECVKPGKKIGDKSSLSFSLFSEPTALSIDLEKFKSLSDKQSFINSTGKYKTCGLQSKLMDLEDKAKLLYQKVSNPGMDLISLLIEKIENQALLKKDQILSANGENTYTHFDNQIYIFTDGYLEYKLSGKFSNGQYYFGGPQIEKIRKYCVAKGVNISKALEQNKSLRLPIAESKENQYINLHILETEERDKDVKFFTYSHPKGLRDNEILEAVWRKWAKDSGFKSLEWKKY
jgi:hypothetical protein